MELVPIGEKCQPEMHLFVFTNMAAMSRANQLAIGHFSVVHSVPWPLSRSEAGGDLVLLQTLLLFHVQIVSFSQTQKHLPLSPPFFFFGIAFFDFICLLLLLVFAACLLESP